MKVIIDPATKFENELKLVKKMSKLAKFLGIKKKVKVILTKKYDTKGSMGYMYALPGKKNIFVIGVNQDLNEEQMLETIGHEMQHVKQQVKGHLKIVVNEKEGTVKKLWKGEDHTKTPYFFQPWEIEARANQVENAKLLA